jgi:sulfur relay (sulfurtransferase) complex TusBCD TusD component (DsrE family)
MNILTCPILSCATCMSSRGEATTDAAGMAILFMLIILIVVFGGIFKFMRYLSQCERKFVGRR